ncbi:hypothetical protein BD779DRAFT_1465741 [Infundibulicybe gibba]|nr:hypothetical protein BD779DRAFT_1465741 [Infundibulicybe gibba]
MKPPTVAAPTSAIPDFYYFCFAAYEPFLTTHDAQAPWPAGLPPPDELPRATRVTILQLAHVCALIGVVNYFVLSAARRHLHANPALQEKIVFSLLAPLLVGDVLHLYVTLWALGDLKWDVWNWSPMLWTTIILGLTLMVPRVAWHMGIGRYVDRRDGQLGKGMQRMEKS